MDMSKPYGQRCAGFMTAQASGDLQANLDRAPILVVDGVEAIGESKAIERFLARRCGLMGKTDVEAAQIDAFCEHIRDLKEKYGSASDKAKFASETLPALLRKMEKKAGETALVGQALSLADVALYEIVCEHFPARAAYMKGKGEGCAATLSSDAMLKDCPKLARAVEAVKTHPGVAKHLASRHYTAPW